MKAHCLTSLLALTCTLLFAQELVKNGSFTVDNSGVLHEWTLPDSGQWRHANDDGIIQDGGAAGCLRFTPNGQAPTVVTQKLTLEGKKHYILHVNVKHSGCLPAVRLVDANGNLLNTFTGNKNLNDVWENDAASGFLTSAVVANPITLELIGTTTDVHTGYSCFDNISISEKTAGGDDKLDGMSDAFKPAGPNIARGKSYTFSLKPNYGYCTDKDDAIQLTDGVYSQGYFWVQKSTVGWSRAPLVGITIDLGKEEPICGASWNTAAGTAGVAWPAGLQIFTSNDKQNWEHCGDLILLGTKRGLPPQNTYCTFQYATNELKSKGRYIQFIVSSTSYAFVDEIEVYRGPDNWLTELKPAYAIQNPIALAKGKMAQGSAMVRMKTDLQALTGLIDKLPAPLREKAEAEAKALSDALLDNHDLENMEDYTTELPLGPTHAKILALNRHLLQAQGLRAPKLWHNNRWDNLSITAIPPKQELVPLDIHLMRGEVRGETVNITNPYDEPIAVTFQIKGLPAGANLKLYEVLVTDTKQNVPVTDALRPANALPYAASGRRLVVVPAGCTRQLWLSFDRPAAKAGTYSATLNAKPGSGNFLNSPEADSKHRPIEAKLTLTIYDKEFPSRPTLHVGGWDYVNGGNNYYKSPNNLVPKLALMKDIYVDSPWATNAVMPKGAVFDAEGTITNEESLDFTNWNEWTALFPEARNYCVFWSVGTTFQKEEMGTPRFEKKLGQYLNAWCRYLKKTGVNPKQLVILLLDEPHNHEQDTTIITWAKAIKATCPDITLFEDPTYLDPTKALPELYTCVDILCPHTPHRVSGGQAFRDFYVKQREDGRTLWLYSCHGPSRLLDPVTYHRGQMWHAFDMGAVGTFYWALGCGGGIGDSFKAYSQSGTEYSPFFVSPTGVMQSKHSEGIREGVQDYEYMVMLRKRIADLRKQGKTAQADKAQAVLDSSLARVFDMIKSAGSSWEYWEKDKDRSVMDEARIAILKALVE